MTCLTGCLAAGGWTLWIGLAVAILPSLVTALAPHPKAAGAARVVLGLLSRLSVLTHRDAAGTMKWPLVAGKGPAAPPAGAP